MLLLALNLSSLQACTSWQINELASALPQAGPEATLKRLADIDPSDRDSAQYLLDRGMLKFYGGDLSGSQQDLQQAKAIMLSLKAVSISENFAALTTNETLRSYAGAPSEQVLVHALLAMTYLMTGNPNGARVEMLQADVTMKQLADATSTNGQLASVRFLAGLIYEMNGELDDALISYRMALRIIKDRGELVPEALASSLLSVSRRQNNEDEYTTYVSEFGRQAALPKANEGEWIVYYHDGVVTNLAEARLSVFDPGLKTLISVVVPQYPPSRYQARHLTIQTLPLDTRPTTQTATTEIIELIERRAREDLASQSAKLLAAATVRAVAKYQLVQEAQKSGPLGGIIANIAGVLSEQADVRSWNMLPSSIQVARFVAPLDASVQIVGKGMTLPALQNRDSDRLSAGRYAVVLVNSLNDTVLSYPPPSKLPSVEGQPHE